MAASTNHKSVQTGTHTHTHTHPKPKSKTKPKPKAEIPLSMRNHKKKLTYGVIAVATKRGIYAQRTDLSHGRLMYIKTAVPNIFGTRNWFCGRQFGRVWVGWGVETEGRAQAVLPTVSKARRREVGDPCPKR